MVNTKNITEEELVRLLKDKDERVLNILYEKYSLSLFGVIHRVLNNQELSEERLQECFLKIWKNGDKYDPNKGRLFTWMLTIARNLAIDTTRTKGFREQGKIQNLENSVTIIEKVNSVEMNTDEIGIRDLIQKLNTKYAQIIDVIYFQGYTQSEAAKELNLPLGTVKTRTRKALALLKGYII